MKQTHLMEHARRMCAAVGTAWLAALVTYLAGANDWARWLFLGGAVLAAGLAGMLLAAYLRERRAGHSDAESDK